MIPDSKLKISLQELSSKGAMILAQQSEIQYATALRQVMWLKRISKVTQLSKKSKANL
jgi:hypothetical protein